MDEEDRLLTVQEVSQYFRVGEESIRRWLREGKLEGISLGRGAGWRIRKKAIEDLVASRLRPATARNASSSESTAAPQEVEITCVVKEDLQNPHAGVLELGSATHRWSRAEAIEAIEASSHVFFTQFDGDRSDVAVFDGPFRKYLRTRRNGAWNDTLLNLPSCPDS
jgi:excisionase family DNA binding protein